MKISTHLYAINPEIQVIPQVLQTFLATANISIIVCCSLAVFVVKGLGLQLDFFLTTDLN